MEKFIGGLVCGVIATLILWFSVKIYPEVTRNPDEGIRDFVSVQKHRVTGHYSVEMGPMGDATLGITKARHPMIIANVGDDGSFHIAAIINTNTTLAHVSIVRNKDVPWNGQSFRDQLGQQWELVYVSTACWEHREKISEGTFTFLLQGIWIADRVYTDGKSVFFERIQKDGNVYDRWRLVSPE